MGLHLGLQPAALQAAVTLPQPRVVLGQLENTVCTANFRGNPISVIMLGWDFSVIQLFGGHPCSCT